MLLNLLCFSKASFGKPPCTAALARTSAVPAAMQISLASLKILQYNTIGQLCPWIPKVFSGTKGLCECTGSGPRKEEYELNLHVPDRVGAGKNSFLLG